MKYFFKKLLKIFAWFFGALMFLWVFFYFAYSPELNPKWGVSFSSNQAEYLGLNWKQAYQTIVTELKPQTLRLMAYWENLEKQPGQYSFEDIDYMLKIAEENKIAVLLVLGHKQPRWPECHSPGWYKNLDSTQKEQAVLKLVEKSVEHFKAFASVSMWQVENEPFFNYGEDCPILTKKFLQKEIGIVKSMDIRPVVVTDSGEKGWWFPSAWSGANIFGATMYREAFYGEKQKYVKYPLPATLYRVRAGMLSMFSSVKRVIGTELQAEPWFKGGFADMYWEEQREHMNPEIFRNNINYAKKSGFEAHYFWGVEWWLWAKEQGHPEMWEAAQAFFNQ